MQFAHRKTLDAIVQELATADVPGLAASAESVKGAVVALIRVIATILVNPKDTWPRVIEMLHHFRIRPSMGLDQIAAALADIQQGHAASRGTRGSVPASRPFFEQARSTLAKLLARRDEPSLADPLLKAAIIALVSETDSHLASVEFYECRYAQCRQRIQRALYSLNRAADCGDFRAIGISDKQLNLQTFDVAAFAAASVRERLEASRFGDVLTATFDEAVTQRVELSLAKAGAHDATYVDPLARLVDDVLLKREPTALSDRLRDDLIWADRREYLRACGKYIANRAYAQLALYSLGVTVHSPAMVEAGSGGSWPVWR